MAISSTLIIAIIAGIASLISAIIAWKQAERVKRLEVDTQQYLGRLNADTEVGIEKFKADNERAKKALELAIRESQPVEHALKQMWQLIQTIKDQVSRVDWVPSQDDLREKLTSVRDASEKMQEIYSETGFILPGQARLAAHDAKNLAFLIQQELHGVVRKSNEGPNSESAEEILRIRELRNELTRCQGVLAGARAELLIDQLHEYTDLLASAYKEKKNTED